VRSCLASSEDHGCVLDEAEVVFWGSCPLCPTCRAMAAVPDDDDEKDPPHYKETR
jgi:hypothetical protein